MKIDRFSFNNVVLRDEGEFLCLTDMWRAAGSDESKRPVEWLRSASAQEFIEFIAENLKVGNSHVELLRVNRGGTEPGTWAHWQLALAYAKYLSPAFHAWCNDVVRKVMQGEISANGHALALLTSLVEKMDERLNRLEANQVALWRHHGELADQIPIGGSIPAVRHNALTNKIYMVANVEVRVGKWQTRRAALADIRRAMGVLTQWGGKGRRWNTLPAHLEPVADAILNERFADATKREKPRQLSLIHKKSG